MKISKSQQLILKTDRGRKNLSGNKLVLTKVNSKAESIVEEERKTKLKETKMSSPYEQRIFSSQGIVNRAGVPLFEDRI